MLVSSLKSANVHWVVCPVIHWYLENSSNLPKVLYISQWWSHGIDCSLFWLISLYLTAINCVEATCIVLSTLWMKQSRNLLVCLVGCFALVFEGCTFPADLVLLEKSGSVWEVDHWLLYDMDNLAFTYSWICSEISLNPSGIHLRVNSYQSSVPSEPRNDFLKLQSSTWVLWDFEYS